MANNSKNKKGHPALIKIILLFAVAFVVGYYGFIQYPQIRAQKQELVDIHTRISKETTKKDQLVAQSKQESSNEYVEDVARRDLGMLKPNETVYVDIAKNK